MLYRYQRYIARGLSRADLEQEDLAWVELSLFIYAKEKEYERKEMDKTKFKK